MIFFFKEQRQQKINELKSSTLQFLFSNQFYRIVTKFFFQGLDDACISGDVVSATSVLLDAGLKFLPLIINGHRDEYTPLYRLANMNDFVFPFSIDF